MSGLPVEEKVSPVDTMGTMDTGTGGTSVVVMQGNQVSNDLDGASHLRMWNPVRDARSPSDDEFSVPSPSLASYYNILQSIEQAFGRFVNFMKNRDEAGLSPESVRLLHTFYTQLDAASKEESSSSSSALAFVPADCPVHDLANHIQIRRQLEGRHLSVLVNLIMMLVEEEQKEVQRMLKFYNLLSESTDNRTDNGTDNGEIDGALYQALRDYPPERLVEIKALTQV